MKCEFHVNKAVEKEGKKEREGLREEGREKGREEGLFNKSSGAREGKQLSWEVVIFFLPGNL